jgi:2-succinyl-5-enolpyruvyl-6-hydroxy-3-cyclohexene-1-carboxylate synthase
MDPTNRNTALASAFVEELARCGMRRAVLAPGSRSTPLALALWRAPAIHTTVLVDERSAGFFALGAAQASGVPVAVLCTSGTAAANLHPAVCEADEAGVPLIVLTADRPPELRAIGAGQTIDQLKLYGDAVRWFCEVGTHEADDDGLLHLRASACRAFARARGEPRPGPVHLNLSWRDPLGPEPRHADVTATSQLALAGRGERPLTAVTGASLAPAAGLLDELADRIGQLERGLIVAGRQADPALAESIAGLARATGYPVLAEPTSQVRLGPHERTNVVWAYESIARLRPAALSPRLIIRFGDMPTCKPLREWLGALDEARQVVVDPTGGWNEPSRRAETIVRSDPAAVARGLADRCERGAGDWTRTWLRASEAAATEIANELSALREITEPGTHAALGELYEDGDLVYTASSMPIRDQEAFVPAGPAAVRFLANRGANGIDGLISSGIGAAVASGRPSWIVTGELGLFHDMNGLAALAQASVPVRMVVLDNRGGGIFEFLPQADQIERGEFEALFGTEVPIALADVTALHHLPHVRLESLDELGDHTRETALIEVPVDRRANVALHRRLAAAAVAAVEGSLQATREAR